MPTLAADVHEGRTTLLDAVRYELRGFWPTLLDALHRDYDPTPGDVARRSWYGRLVARMTDTPGRTLGVVGLEVVLALALLAQWRDSGSWGRWLFGALLALTLLDVAWHALMAPGMFRRRRAAQHV